MAEISTIARPYAQAAFDVAKAANALPAWNAFLGKLAALASNDEVQQFATNPSVKPEQVIALFTDAAGSVTDEMKNFMSAVVDSSRIDALPAVYEAFAAQQHAFEGSADALVTTAFTLNDAEAADLKAALEQKMGKKLNTTFTVDESLIGGFSVSVGDEVLDMSVRAKLARMQSALTA